MFWKPGGVERLANGRHAAVHHVAGRHDVGAGTGVRDGGFGKPVRVVSLSTSPSDEAAVAVTGVFAVADVGDHQQLGMRALDGANGALRDAVWVVSARGQLVLRTLECRTE